MHGLTVAFIAFIIAGIATRTWLATRQLRHVAAGRERVPDAFRQDIGLDEHQKAAAYTSERTRFARVDDVVDTAVLLALTLGGGIALIDALWRGVGLGPLLTGILVILTTLIAVSAISIPLAAYRTFGIEAKYGFNKTTPGLFVADLFRGLLLYVLIGTPLIAIILWLMSRAGSLWWLYAWLVWVAFTLFMTWAYPTLIAPLFNKFSPLDKDALRARIESLLTRCGFRSSGIFVMDGSRRSAHGNAYFTGLGSSKRIVFFDTLLDSLDDKEIEAVLAHELGHFRLRHIAKRLSISLAIGLAGLALLGWLIQKPWFFTALGVSDPSTHAALLLFALVIPVFAFFLSPLGSYYSRRHEFEADEYAAQQSDARALVSALVKLYKDNATTLTPDPVYSTFYDSHPPAPVRISRLKGLASGEAGSQ